MGVQSSLGKEGDLKISDLKKKRKEFYFLGEYLDIYNLMADQPVTDF